MIIQTDADLDYKSEEGDRWTGQKAQIFGKKVQSTRNFRSEILVPITEIKHHL